MSGCFSPTILRRGAAAAAFLSLLISACSTLLAARQQHRLAAQVAVVSGTVATEYEAHGPLVVGIVAITDSGYYLADHFVTEKAGPFIFAVSPGRYFLAAFEDTNGDGHYDEEPALRGELQDAFDLTPGQRVDGFELRIPRQGRFRQERFSLAEMQMRSVEEQQQISIFALSVAGSIASLDDARFDPSVADAGMWKFYDFFLQIQPGIYFLHDYDAAKIPVLFVHGMRGTPRSFAPLVEALDREHFQPWFFYYPSGASLDTLALLLDQLFVRLRVQHGFKRAAVVAHSMGGLVTRAFLLAHYEETNPELDTVYVTISSPLGGMISAGKGVERSPVVLSSWRGLAPGSAFLDGLFYSDPETKTRRRRLPASVSYHMLFGFHGGALSGSSDGIVPLASQLRSEAQREARSMRGFDETHTSILDSPAVARRLNEILASLH